MTQIRPEAAVNPPVRYVVPKYYSQIEGLGTHVVYNTHYVITIKNRYKIKSK